MLRSVFDTTLGAEWLKRLSNQVRQAVEQTAEIARKQRPNETLRDDWAAVGIGEIAATLRSTWPTLNGALAGVWLSPDEATVDLSRLVAYRGKNLHAVGPPQGQIKDEEVAAMILRLRIGFEGLRRSLAHDDGKWWPYIEAIHSNIPEFCFDRTTPPTLREPIVLSEGDLVRFEVVGVHPQAPQDRLRYQLTGGYAFSEAFIGSGWVEHSEFRVSVPRKRDVDFFLYIADVDDPKNPDMRSFRCFQVQRSSSIMIGSCGGPDQHPTDLDTSPAPEQGPSSPGYETAYLTATTSPTPPPPPSRLSRRPLTGSGASPCWSTTPATSMRGFSRRSGHG